MRSRSSKTRNKIIKGGYFAIYPDKGMRKILKQLERVKDPMDKCKHNWVIAYYCFKCGKVSPTPMSRRINAVGKYDSCCIANDYLEVARGDGVEET